MSCASQGAGSRSAAIVGAAAHDADREAGKCRTRGSTRSGARAGRHGQAGACGQDGAALEKS